MKTLRLGLLLKAYVRATFTLDNLSDQTAPVFVPMRMKR